MNDNLIEGKKNSEIKEGINEEDENNKGIIKIKIYFEKSKRKWRQWANG